MNEIQAALANTRPDPEQLKNTLLALKALASDGNNRLSVSDRYVLANAMQYLEWLAKAVSAAEEAANTHARVNEALQKIHDKMMATGVSSGLILVSDGGEVKEVTEDMAKDIVNNENVPDEVKEQARQFLEQIAAVRESGGEAPLPLAPDGSTLQ